MVIETNQPTPFWKFTRQPTGSLYFHPPEDWCSCPASTGNQWKNPWRLFEWASPQSRFPVECEDLHPQIKQRKASHLCLWARARGTSEAPWHFQTTCFILLYALLTFIWCVLLLSTEPIRQAPVVHLKHYPRVWQHQVPKQQHVLMVSMTHLRQWS